MWSISGPGTYSPLGHIRACSSCGPDCGFTVLAIAMVLCRKTSPVLTGLDKGDEIINKILPLWVPVNTMDKKSYVANCTSWQLRTTPADTLLHGQSVWALQLTNPSSPAQSFGISAETCYIWLSDLKSGVREGPLAPCPFWTEPGTKGNSNLVQQCAENRGDHGESMDAYHNGGVCYCPQRTTIQPICVCVHTVHQAATTISQA